MTNTIRTIVLSMLAVLMITAAYAQSPRRASAAGELTLGGRAVAVGPRVTGPTPLFTVGDLAVGIWTRVPPPYNVEADRNAAANPLP